MAIWNTLSESARRERTRAGLEALRDWQQIYKQQVIDPGNPIGKSLRVSVDGIVDTQSHICGYAVITAESHEAAAQLFKNHPHFTIFPGGAVDVMECLSVPRA